MHLPILIAASAAALGSLAGAQLPVRHAEGAGHFGQALSASGDLNGDGIADLAIGAPLAPLVIGTPGMVRVISGADGSVLLTVFGAEDGARFGGAVGDAGDVDGDGHDDLVVGAELADAGGVDAGMVFVLSGAGGATRFALPGAAAGDRFGAAVAGAGDVDADGHDDIVVGAPGANAGAGAAYVLSGADGAVLRVLPGQPSPGAFGTAVAGAGDVDGDGCGDVIVGAPGTGLVAGAAYVYAGADGRLLHTLSGFGLGDGFGSSVAGAGSIDGDRFDDVLVGAPGFDFSGADVGAAFVFAGASGSLLRIWFGQNPGQAVGAACAGAGDVDGDGRDDLVIGAPGGAVPVVEVLSGRTSARLASFRSPSTQDGFGRAVAGRHDCDADGLPEVAVGAPLTVLGGVVTGRAYVFDAGYAANASRETIHGVACASASGRIPRVGNRGRARIGETLAVTLRGGPRNDPAAILLPGEPLGHPLGLALDVLGLAGCALHANPYASFAVGTDAFGKASVPVPLVNDPSVIGFTFTFQWVVADPGSARALPLALSDALTVRIGG